MLYKLLIIVAFLFVAFGCTSTESTVQNLQFFELDDEGAIVKIEGNVRYTLLTSDEDSLAAQADRIVDLQTGKVLSSNGSFDELKTLDTLSFSGIKVRRYIFGMGKIDGLSLLGISENNQVLFVANPTWRSGAATLYFIEEYEAGKYDESVLILNLPRPRPPERFE